MKKSLFNKILCVALIFSFVLPNVVFAQDLDIGANVTTKESVEKNVFNFGSTAKLISWEDENEMIFEQYDENDELVERVVIDKKTERVTSYTEELGVRSIQLETFKNKAAESDITPRSAKKVDTVTAFNILTSASKNMDIYETTSVEDVGDYSIPKTSTTVARFVAQLALALKLPAEASGNLLAAMVSVGICMIVDEAVVAILDVKVNAEATYYTYYGKDTASGKKSSNYQSGTIFKVTDSGKYLNETYIEGDIYDNTSAYKIAKLLAQNLYGVDFDVDV